MKGQGWRHSQAEDRASDRAPSASQQSRAAGRAGATSSRALARQQAEGTSPLTALGARKAHAQACRHKPRRQS